MAGVRGSHRQAPGDLEAGGARWADCRPPRTGAVTGGAPSSSRTPSDEAEEARAGAVAVAEAVTDAAPIA